MPGWLFFGAGICVKTMGKVVGPPLEVSIKEWILKQRLFFHASAPLSQSSRVNVSPKSTKEFRIVNDQTVGWLDLTGSGSETCAHIVENGRLTILFVALEGPPKIVRLHGTGSIILPSDLSKPENEQYSRLFKDCADNIGMRAIVVLNITRVSQSCGFSIPIFEFKSCRTTLDDVTNKKGCEGIREYRKLKNAFSIDGLPSIAQLETVREGVAPTEVEWSDGFIYVKEYGKSWWKQLSVSAGIKWHFFQPVISYRDVALFTAGVAVGSLAFSFGRRLTVK